MAGDIDGFPRAVAVVGLGTMGAGIVEVFARSGLPVVGVEAGDEALARGRGHVEGSTNRAVQRGKLAEPARRELLDRITFSTSLGAAANADLVIEAVPERLELKRQVLTALDRVCRPEAVLATNTSSLSVTELAAATDRAPRVVGMHFFNPAPVMRLVEVVTTVVTDPAVVADVEALARRLGKVDVTVGDRAGFIANALLFGYLNHAVAMYESRYASRDDIDAAMTLACGLPMGPLTLLDLIGLDTAYEILDTMYRESRDRLHAPSPLLRQLVTAGLIGRKSGRGFYTYDESGAPVGDVPTAPQSGGTVRRVGVVGGGATSAGVAEAFDQAGYDVATTGHPAADRELASCDLVVAADDRAVAQEVFAALDQACRPGALLATTSSAVPVAACAAATGRAGDVIGLHFPGPAPAARVVEVVHTARTSADAVATALAVCGRLGKRPVRCGDRAGFVVDALLYPYLNDAVKMLEAGYASTDDIDAAMTAGCGYPAGPFEQLAAVGLDAALAMQRRLYREFREPGLAPAPLLEHLVTVGAGPRDYAAS